MADPYDIANGPKGAMSLSWLLLLPVLGKQRHKLPFQSQVGQDVPWSHTSFSVLLGRVGGAHLPQPTPWLLRRAGSHGWQGPVQHLCPGAWFEPSQTLRLHVGAKELVWSAHRSQRSSPPVP